MKVYGMFRGFPGLGRVVSGIEILRKLRDDWNFETRIFTYYQGVDLAKSHGFDVEEESELPKEALTSIGINPVSYLGSKILTDIIEWDPDLVICDGEPLMIQALSLSFPKERIVSLLNPYDVQNPHLPMSSQNYFRNCYLSAGIPIVHGLWNIDVPSDYQGTPFYSTGTILRDEVLKLRRKQNQKREVVCVLGGGTQNTSQGFFDTTVEMGKRVLEVAKKSADITYKIYTNDKIISNTLNNMEPSENVQIYDVLKSPEHMFTTASVVICRAGRNTTSELLYLGIPTILIATGNDFRAKEQESNISRICEMSNGLMRSVAYNVDAEVLQGIITEQINTEQEKICFTPGNEEIENLLIQSIKEKERFRYADNH